MFDQAEYDGRVQTARQRMRERGLDAMLLFAQESHYYLFGYDSSGYVFFQVVVLTTEDQPTTLLCRLPDVAQARDTSTIDDIRVWLNAEDANPAENLKAILQDRGLENAVIGMELDTYGLTAANDRLIMATLDGFCELVDASDVIRGMRLVKSASEMAYIKQAAALADAAVEAIFNAASPGVLESHLAGCAQAAILGGGGDPAPAGPLINSGSRAVYGRSVAGPRRLSKPDQVLIELAGTYRRYNCCIERTLLVGDPTPAQRDMHSVVAETMQAVLDAFVPGEPLGRVNEVHQDRLDRAGYATERFAACGYSLGATYRPSWMDVPPMIYSGNPLIMEPGMVFFPHVMLADQRARLAIGLGNTVVITETGAESLSQLSLDLLVKP
ncbi:MAG: hypothetical protein ETSY1_35345 [Candidatus Entotheonella factor]|uniref:Xaa-Pro dipeptidase n=1 Tax=Entotheonella factor TaxID=1429438 RepID=W4L8K7_ENTF1|nr:Xaa-Pro peptidase family protein [Candidatus Entotheonella palauensis]ETW94337.1 MAG: hypothetical protein ETSY1_35345 [Candidatus Entotheonella factor]